MATSSITHNFVISKQKSIKNFVKAIEIAENNRSIYQKLPGRQLTDPNQILALMKKREKKNA